MVMIKGELSVMDERELKKFLADQREEMLKHRWIESEKAGCDVGQKAVLEWVERYGNKYRTWWERYKR